MPVAFTQEDFLVFLMLFLSDGKDTVSVYFALVKHASAKLHICKYFNRNMKLTYVIGNYTVQL